MKRFLRGARTSPASAVQPRGIAHGEAFKRVLIAGQIGSTDEGGIPNGLEAQLDLAFDNLLAVVEAAQLAAADLVKIVAYVTAPGSLALYERVRARKLGAATPVSTYIEVAGLGDPRWLVSLEGEAISENRP